MRIVFAVVVSLLSSAALAESYPFDRVFTNERERRLINRLAESTPIEEQVEEVARDLPDDDIVAPETLTFSGVLKKNDGFAHYWIDGKSYLTNDRDLPFLPHRESDQGASFLVDGLESTLKPGQIWYIGRGLVLEAWEPRPAPESLSAADAPAGSQSELPPESR